MDPTTPSLWERFQKYFVSYADLDFALDISRMRFADDFLSADDAAGGARIP